MSEFYINKNTKIHQILSIVKLGSILFLSLTMLNAYFELNNLNVYSRDSYFLFLCSTITILTVSILYFIWLFVFVKKLNRKHYIIASTIEHFFLLFIFSLIILFSGAYESNYKISFLFIVITSTIQLGMKCGLTIVAVSSCFLLGMDLIMVPDHLISEYFSNDIIVCAIFFFTAWPLGYYNKLEKEHIEALEGLVNIDDLTGVYNHRFFQQSVNESIIRAEKENLPVSLLFIDIDYFKDYNDLYGHIQGDKLLATLSSIIKRCVRSKDVVARYGGDEFAIILPDTCEEDAILIGERIRKSIDNTYFEGQENLRNKKITASIGVSTYPHKANTKDELIKSADDALYRAKFFNRNRVEVYSSILEELKEDIQEEHIDIISSIKTLIGIINAKDKYTYGHTERVVIYCDTMAEELDLSEEDKKTLKYGAYLHDIGKIEIPQEILNKKMKLTDEEWEYIKKHPMDGAEIMKQVPSLEQIGILVLHHHEKYDGSGYPKGLKGKQIPYLVRILAIADSFDAMTSSRPYQTRKSHEEAFKELRRCKGTQFDPELVEVFIRALQKTLSS